MLRLPGEEDSIPPLVMPKPKPQKAESSRGRRERRAAEVFDETFAKKEKTDPMLVRIVVAGAVTLAIVLLVGLLWPSSQRGQAPAVGDNILPSDLIDLPDPDDDELSLDTLSPAMVTKQLEPVIQSFLEAPTMEEAANLCRRPTRTLQRMKAFHGDDYYAPGFRRVFIGGDMSRDGDWAILGVEDKQFRQQPIALVLDGAKWKIDWESWAGWSEVTLDELRKEKPTEPVLVRAIVQPTEYYNFGFSDDSRWSSYRLLDPDKMNTVYGYVPSLGELDLRLKPNPNEKELRFTLRVRFPDGAQSDNQLIIDEIVSKDWVVKEDIR